MPVEIRVGPPIIKVNRGTTFLVTHLNGEIDPQGMLGAFASDTRFISSYHLWINRRPWTLVNSSALSHFTARWVYANPEVHTDDGPIGAEQIGLILDRAATAGGIHEDLEVVNYSMRRAQFFLEVEVQADFADVFDVKNNSLTERGEKVTTWHPRQRRLVTSYRHRTFRRALELRFHKSTTPPRYANGLITFPIDLKPGARWRTCMVFFFAGARDAIRPDRRGHPGARPPASLHAREHKEWHNVAARCRSSNKTVEGAFRQAVDDLGSLRIFETESRQETWIPAAGLPWFMTLFGRDSLIVSLQSLPVHTLFARAALERLATLQAQAFDDDHDAQPGRIMHEIRHGELAALDLIPQTPYYGTWDATPLYLIVLSEAYRWTGDLALVRRYLPAAEKCLAWIDRYGDEDQDGFQEYRTRSARGYRNQGWKDAHDALVYPDGRQVDPPIGTCELQGYVYDAKLRMAELYDVLERPRRARTLRRQAATLKQRFNDRFWMPDEAFFAFGLDRQKKQIKSIASNPGQCLWSGIVDDRKAESVVRRLLRPDMWSGWGIRTLSSDHKAYNPFSYQLGSVWPHDNGLIALGFRRYGFAREAAQVAKGLFDASACFDSLRLPELFAGLARQPESFPVQYLGANVPQAWSAGSIFMLLTALLGLEADAARHRLAVDPWLPDWLPEIELQNVVLGSARFHLAVRGSRQRCRVELQRLAGEVDLLEGRRLYPAIKQAG